MSTECKVNSTELRVARLRHGMTAEDTARQLGIHVNTYRSKERGATAFSDEEKLKLCEMFDMSIEEFSTIFFDGRLPIGMREVTT